jgi:putative hemolysin
VDGLAQVMMKENGMLSGRFGATLLFGTLLAAMLSGCGSTQSDISSPAAYCRSVGGTVQARIPEYGTNNQNPLKLAGIQDFCKFTGSDNTAIFISTDTLYADKPTLAALAYYAQTPAQNAPNGENPASVYCTQLGGSDLFGGKNAAGGGWVDTSDKTFTTVEACVFPDLSIIDSFGLFYHSNGTIRGIDLSTVLRYEAPPR